MVRTNPASYGDLMLFFAQLHSLVRSGVAVPDAVGSVAGRVRNKGLVRACREMTPRLQNGGTLHGEMARFPDLFAPGIVGAVESGEKGGYLADALDMIAKQNKGARSFDLFFWWVPLLVLNTVLSLWLMNMLAGVVSRGIDVLADKAPNEKIVETGLADRGLGPTGIGLIVLIVLLVFWMWAKNQTFTRVARHKLATLFPIIKKRTKAECLTLFSWHLSRLSKAGLSPFSSYHLAASAVPNMEISRRLSEEGKGVRDSTSFGPLLASSSLMPVEYGGLIATGEQVGRLPEALDEVSEITEKEGEDAARWFKMRVGCWGILVLIGGGLLAFMVVYGTYLSKVFDLVN
jgi:general secretion pathway protein F/type IV pilus assembly protein PilC